MAVLCFVALQLQLGYGELKLDIVTIAASGKCPVFSIFLHV